MVDIVEELRKCANDPQDVTLGGWEAYSREAADEIERLRKALEKIIIQNNFGFWGRNNVEKIARAALKENK